MFFRFFAAAAFFAAILAGCATQSRSPAPERPTPSQTVLAPVSNAPGTLTFCGLTAEAHISKPSAELPENLRRFYGAWLGETYNARYGNPCSAMVVTNISSDGTADIVSYYRSKIPYVDPDVGPRRAKISGDTMTYVSPKSWRVSFVFVGPDRLRVHLHSIDSGAEVEGFLQRVGSEEERSVQ